MYKYETLRLYGSIVFIPRSTNLESQAITLQDGRNVNLPAATAVNLNIQALHTDPRTWGADSLSWKPDRWLQSAVGQSNKGSPNDEVFITHENGSFIPWADGPRVCPGQKFAQVEFVAVMATLIGSYHVKPVLIKGRTTEDGKNALLEMIDDSAISAITLQMQNPARVSLQWEKIED